MKEGDFCMNENEYMLQGSVIKKFTFVLMPFRDDFNNIYQFGIKAACQAEGVYCERVDEQYYEGSSVKESIRASPVKKGAQSQPRKNGIFRGKYSL